MDGIRDLLLQISSKQVTLIRKQDVLLRPVERLESRFAASSQRFQSRMDLLERKISNQAVKEVLRIPQLVENILLNLHPVDILWLQAQSHFKSVTEGSSALQQKLFLKPCTTLSSTSEAQLNPSLFKRSADQFESLFQQLDPALVYTQTLPDGPEEVHLSLFANISRKQNIRRSLKRILRLTISRIFTTNNGELTLLFYPEGRALCPNRA